MKRIKRLLLWFAASLVVLIVILLLYLKLALPNVGAAPDLIVERTPERVARGKYLANHVTVCIDCHSTRDWSKFSGPPTEGTLGMGGDVFNHKFGFPGTYYAANITPAGISKYTDGELFRLITTGVTREGKAIFPVMPYRYYGQLDEEDVKSIIAYIRTLEPVQNTVPKSSSDFPMNFIINVIPQKADFTRLPERTDIIGYGRYLTTASGCVECHTRFDKGRLVKGTEFGGGREFPLADGSIVRSGNITPDSATGIGNWNKATFRNLFHARTDSTTLNTKLEAGAFNSVMPWTMYGGMTDEDINAIYAYLRTIKPITNKVIKFTSASE
jgi:mono/diheme cytochrome c family protein